MSSEALIGCFPRIRCDEIGGAMEEIVRAMDESRRDEKPIYDRLDWDRYQSACLN